MTALRRCGVLATFTAFALAGPALGDNCAPGNLFVNAAAYPAVDQPFAPVSADFNGDGRPDVATLGGTYQSIRVSVLLANPDGSFAAPIEGPLVEYGSTLVAGLFNSGLAVDLVVGRYDGQVATLLGNGDGTFQPPIVSTFPESNLGITKLAAGFLDGGGSLDLAATTGSSGFALVLLGNGDGTFSPPAAYPIIGSANSLVIADLDGDSHNDVVTAGGNALSVLLGDGDGTLGPPAPVYAGSELQDVEVADFNLDFIPDLAVVSSQQFVAVLIGAGDATFHAAHFYPAGPNPGEIAIRDGRDIVAASATGYSSDVEQIWILTGDFHGNFEAGPGYLLGQASRGLIVADFGGDGWADVASLSYDPGTLIVATGNPDGTLQAIRVVLPQQRAEEMVAADFNGDGRPDLALRVSGAVRVVIQTPDGDFYVSSDISPPEASSGLAAGDFDGDGKADLLVGGSSSVFLYPGDGAGGFGSPTEIAVDGYGLLTLTAADFRADGWLDFALTVSDGNIGGNVAVYPGNGDGTFRSPVLSPLSGRYSTAVAADLNNDGKVDMAFAGGYYFGEFSPIVPVLLGLGGGAFQPAIDYEVGALARSVSVADLGDGNFSLDLVTANSTDTISLLYSGSPQSPGLIGLSWIPWRVVAADFDGDNRTDLVTSNRDANNAAVLRGLGSGKFESPRPFPVTSRPVPLLVFDLFGNGTPDVVAASTDPGGLALLVNSKLAVAPLAPSGACAGGSANIQARAGGVGPLTYQWRKDGVPLSDGGHIAGSQTAVLIILTAGPEDEGAYDVVVTDLCDTVTSSTTDFVVADLPPVPSIVVDPTLPPNQAGLTASIAAPIAGHSYLWSLEGAVITEGQGTATVTFTTGLPGTLSLSVEDLSAPGCGTFSTDVTVPIDFTDVPPGNPFHADVVTIAQLGITGGCGGGNYCPDAPVTRAQMAVFLLKSKYGSSHVPPIQGPFFDDVPNGSFAADWINELYSNGVTGGCGGQDYCPDASVTRAQMAVFLLKTLIGGYYDPGYVPSPFGDVPNFSFAYNYIAEVYSRGITGGCSALPLLYCPDSPVTRGQMAAFLVRTFIEPAP